MQNLQQLNIRTYLQTRFQNYSLNPDTYLKSLGVADQLTYDRYTAPQSLTTTQQFQLLLLDLEPHLEVQSHWENKMKVEAWLKHCQELIQKTEKIRVESGWWFSGLFKVQDLEEITKTLKQILVYKLTLLYQLFVADYQLIRSLLLATPSRTFFNHQIFWQDHELVFQENVKITELTPPTIEVNPQNQFKACLDDYVVYELQAGQKIMMEAKVNRKVCRQDVKIMMQNLVQNTRSDNQVNTASRQKAGLLEFDLQLRTLGWLTSVKESSTSLTQKTVRFLKFTAPLTISVGGLLLLMYLFRVL